MRSLHTAVIDELTRASEGVITQRQLVAAGVNEELASRQVAAQRWRRLLPGVYLTAPGPATLTQRCYAALLYAGPRAVVSGNAGMLLRGITGGDVSDASVSVLLPSQVRRSSSGFCRVVRITQAPRTQRLVRSGRDAIRVAHDERCVADAIRQAADLGSARARALSALRHRDLDWSLVVRASHRRGPGAGHLSQVVREIADGVRSPAEADVHAVFLRAARRGTFPPYLLNPDVYVDGELLGSPDLWVVGLGLGSEVDSREFHEEVDALDRTLLRHERFSRHQLVLHHVTPSRFAASPQAYLSRLRSSVAERRQLVPAEPEGLVVLARGPLLPDRTPWPQVDPRRWR